jgi:hypothetical protein
MTVKYEASGGEEDNATTASSLLGSLEGILKGGVHGEKSPGAPLKRETDLSQGTPADSSR